MDAHVWVYATIYEYELPFVKVGTKVRVRVPTFPDREFSGEVRALNPVLDAATRSIRVRARVENRDGLLRPQMYLDVTLETDLGEKLAIPEEAVMPTGERHLVFVAQPNGYFQPRNIKLGVKAGQFYEVAEGLEAGERVATSGNFLIDSESRLQGALESVTSQGGQK
jgi:Cu(I)/Ag(I) efflux system membrane fusion protein